MASFIIEIILHFSVFLNHVAGTSQMLGVGILD